MSDHKVLPSDIETHEQAQCAFFKIPPLQELWLNSAIATVSSSNDGKLHVKGYAVPSARAPIDKVQVSMDRGKSWYEACVTYSEGRWAWVLWEASEDAVNEEEAFAAMNTSR